MLYESYQCLSHVLKSQLEDLMVPDHVYFITFLIVYLYSVLLGKVRALRLLKLLVLIGKEEAIVRQSF